VISVCKPAESKSTNDTCQDQPVAPVVSSSTTSNTESTPSTPNLGEELKVALQLRKFTFNELKSATRNFRPESLLGEGGFGCVFKGWINENGTTPVKPGTGVAVAVKTLNHDGLQGHKEWLVREFIIKILFFLCTNIRLEIWAASYFHFYDSKGSYVSFPHGRLKLIILVTFSTLIWLN
jgi:hypothetical protein